MKFGVVEETLGMVVGFGSSWEHMRKRVEEYRPSRWNNPVLVVIPKGWRHTGEEGEVHTFPGGNIDRWVVAVPQSGVGYGAYYIDRVNTNRKRLGLPGTFTPTQETLDVINFRKNLKDLGDFIEKRPLLGDPESLEELEESSKLISKLESIKREREIGEQ